MEALKSLAEMRRIEKAVDDPVKYEYLVEAIKLWMNAWPNQSTGTDVLRASGMYYLCPREFILNYWQPKPNKSFDWMAMLRMSMGTHLHHYLQNYILGPMGVLKGKWQRYDHVERLVGFHPNAIQAIKQITQQVRMTWEYEEEKVWSGQWRISGHMDGLIDVNRIQAYLDLEKEMKDDPAEVAKKVWEVELGEECQLEIKTVGKYTFDNLSGPGSIPDYYKMQACIYQKLSGVHRTLFWYIERDTMQSKVIMYHYEPIWWAEAKRKAKIIWRAIRDEELPETGMKCVLPTDKRAKTCAHCKDCFGDIDFSRYVAEGKERAEKEGRKLLDLSEWECS